MTIDDIDTRLAEIVSAAGDNEQAHVLEDALWADVLEAIASGEFADPGEAAKKALLSLDIEYQRWYA